MHKDIGDSITIHINRYSLHNFALGFDYYRLYSFGVEEHEASIFQLSFLFFNVTITFWKGGI